MKVKRIINGHVIDLEMDKIEKCERFDIYQISKVENGVKVPLFQECFTAFDIRELEKRGYVLDTEDE